jgi:TonB-dependent receptor
VAETLERITGVSGDRFKGNASEISVRGLGPFLGFSTYNGREVSSGSGNRSIAFSQFPSELVSRAAVYKSQQADFIEGGVSATIDLRSVRPLDYGQTRVQADVRASFSDYHARLNDKNGLGYRGSVSYTDLFDTALGAVGVAIGYSRSDAATPEESYNTSSELRPCNSDFRLGEHVGGNCTFSDNNAAAGGGAAADGPYYFIPNLQYFRQMESEETRDAGMIALQWQPNDDWDINFDAQWSNRWYYEDRQDLYLDDGRRRIADWETNDHNALVAYTGESRFGAYGEYRERDETYQAAGLNFQWTPNHSLVLDWDLSWSDTVREQDTWQTRFRSDRVFFDWRANHLDWPAITAIYTDLNNPEGSALDLATIVNDHSVYTADARPRYSQMLVEDSILATNFNAEYFLDGGLITSIKTGVRLSRHDHQNYGEDRWEEQMAGDHSAILMDCATNFPQKNYGKDSTGTITSWATQDTLCVFNQLADGHFWGLNPKDPSANDIDLTEEITAVYAMANFETRLRNLPVSGNVGARIVKTDITSVGYRQEFIVEPVPSEDDPDEFTLIVIPQADTITSQTYRNRYTNVLPSVNVNIGLTDDVQLRLAAYKALSRPDMWWMGAGRDFSTASGEQSTRLVALGNPNLEALESNNYDVSVEWYPGGDTMLSAALYHKTFKAGFAVAEDVQETLVVNNQPVDIGVEGLVINSDESSTITGIELTAQHAFTYLPGPFDGLGVSASYNIADTDYEYREGSALLNTEEFSSEDLGLTPAKLPGFSRQTYNATVYWEKHGVTARLAYKYRSAYLKPVGGSLAQTNRIVEDTASLALSLAYRLNRNFQVRFEALGLNNEPYVEYRVADGAYNRVEYGGIRYFLGVRYRM